MRKSLKALYMRGGTSKGLFIHESQLPVNRDEVLLRLMGSPDSYLRQLDGLGGGFSSTSKVCILKKSERHDSDIDFTFAQVHVDKASVDYKGNCGNMSAAVGPAAIEMGLLPAQDGPTTVRIFNTNTQKIIHSHFECRSGLPIYSGDFAIPGVTQTGAPIRLDFLDPAGASTGKLLPTGNTQDSFLTLQGKVIFGSCVDAANAAVFFRAEDLGLLGTEITNEEFQKALPEINYLRAQAAVKMGIAKTPEESHSIATIPYVGIISSPQSFRSLSNDLISREDQDLCIRVIAGGQLHKALPLTISLCTAVAIKIPGTIAADLAWKKESEIVKLGMPSGVLSVGAQMQDSLESPVASGSFYRTARLLMAGDVFWEETF